MSRRITRREEMEMEMEMGEEHPHATRALPTQAAQRILVVAVHILAVITLNLQIPPPPIHKNKP